MAVSPDSMLVSSAEMPLALTENSYEMGCYKTAKSWTADDQHLQIYIYTSELTVIVVQKNVGIQRNIV